MEENGVAKDAGAGNGDCINEDQVSQSFQGSWPYIP